VAGPSTWPEINKTVETRMQSVIGRDGAERWLKKNCVHPHSVNFPLPFTALWFDNGLVTFETRKRCWARTSQPPDPEFSNVRNTSSSNPTWTVPTVQL